MNDGERPGANIHCVSKAAKGLAKARGSGVLLLTTTRGLLCEISSGQHLCPRVQAESAAMFPAPPKNSDGSAQRTPDFSATDRRSASLVNRVMLFRSAVSAISRSCSGQLASLPERRRYAFLNKLDCTGTVPNARVRSACPESSSYRWGNCSRSLNKRLFAVATRRP